MVLTNLFMYVSRHSVSPGGMGLGKTLSRVRKHVEVQITLLHFCLLALALSYTLTKLCCTGFLCFYLLWHMRLDTCAVKGLLLSSRYSGYINHAQK